MGVDHKVIQPGNGRDQAKPGDTVTIEYTGHIYDEKAASNNFKGKVFVCDHLCDAHR